VSVTGAWYRRDTYDLETQANTLVSIADYAPFQVPNPIDASDIITIYNLNRNKQGLVDLLDTTGTDRSISRVNYNGLEVAFAARLPKGATMFGGWSADKVVTVACAVADPNALRYCDQSQYKMPFQSDFKFAGSQPLPFGVQLGANFASYAGGPLAANWSVPANLFPGGRTQSVTVNLVPPGSKFLNRWSQLDLSFHKIFRLQRTRIDGALDMFNALNSNVVLSENQNYGTSLGQPQAVLQGRLLRLSAQIKF
jgi:hypothetical protein